MRLLAKIDGPTWGFLGLVASAVLALVGTLVTQHKTRRENREDHGTVRDALLELRTDIHEVRDAQLQHMRWHLDQQAHDRDNEGDGR